MPEWLNKILILSLFAGVAGQILFFNGYNAAEPAVQKQREHEDASEPSASEDSSVFLSDPETLAAYWGWEEVKAPIVAVQVKTTSPVQEKEALRNPRDLKYMGLVSLNPDEKEYIFLYKDKVVRLNLNKADSGLELISIEENAFILKKDDQTIIIDHKGLLP